MVLGSGSEDVQERRRQWGRSLNVKAARVCEEGGRPLLQPPTCSRLFSSKLWPRRPPPTTPSALQPTGSHLCSLEAENKLCSSNKISPDDFSAQRLQNLHHPRNHPLLFFVVLSLYARPSIPLRKLLQENDPGPSSFSSRIVSAEQNKPKQRQFLI